MFFFTVNLHLSHRICNFSKLKNKQQNKVSESGFSYCFLIGIIKLLLYETGFWISHGKNLVDTSNFKKLVSRFKKKKNQELKFFRKFESLDQLSPDFILDIM